MDFQRQIESRIFSKKAPSAKEAFENICFALTQEYHWTYDDIVNSPSPYILEMIDKLIDYKKKEQAAMKKKR
jgi:hypothetical protein